MNPVRPSEISIAKTSCAGTEVQEATVEETNVKKIRKDLESIEVEEERMREEIEEIDDQMEQLDKEEKNGLSVEEATGEKREKDEDDIGEEGRSPIMVKAPMRVSREEIELHEALEMSNAHNHK